MSDLNPQQFRMVTNIKTTPGSQGTLFQGGYPTSYHRGYTPERQAEAREHVQHRWTGNPSTKYRNPGMTANTGEQRARLVGNIARSTVPSEDLRAATEHGRPQWFVGQSMEGKIGVYHRQGFSRNGAPAIAIEAGEEDTDTPIHELGHHISASRGTVHSQQYHGDKPEQRGREEAFADNYAQQHWRDRRGNPTVIGQYAGGRTSMERNHSFYHSYNVAREASQPYRQPRPYEDRPDLPPEHVKGQVPLLDKVTSSTWGVSKTSWDYGEESGHKPRSYLEEMAEKGRALVAEARRKK